MGVFYVKRVHFMDVGHKTYVCFRCVFVVSNERFVFFLRMGDTNLVKDKGVWTWLLNAEFLRNTFHVHMFKYN